MSNIKQAHLNARKGKAHYHEVQMVNANEEQYLSQIQDMLKNNTFRNSEYEDNIPFYATIKKIDKYYTFS